MFNYEKGAGLSSSSGVTLADCCSSVCQMKSHFMHMGEVSVYETLTNFLLIALSGN